MATQPADVPLTELPCRNCGDETPGKFCRACGQKKALHTGSLRVVMADALQDHVSLATAMPRTARGLFLHPGFLTREYVAGRIVRYIPPLRLYLVMSVIFFLALSTFGQSKQLIHVETRGSQDTVTARRESQPPAAPSAASSDQGALRTGITAIDSRYNSNIRKLDSLDATSAAEFLNRGVVQRGPTVMFLLLPFYALLLKLFYWRSGAHYAQHFVYALHIHSFAFSALTLMLLTPNSSTGVALSLVLLAWMMIYLYLAQKNVYGQGWIITAAKYAAIGVVYMIAWAFGLLLSVLIAIMLM